MPLLRGGDNSRLSARSGLPCWDLASPRCQTGEIMQRHYDENGDGMRSPALGFLLSINAEGAWCDLLASLMQTDQASTRRVLGLDSAEEIVVRREVSRSRGPGRADRPDLVVYQGARVVAVIEAKLLASLGEEQLERYTAMLAPGDRAACRFLVVSLGGLRLGSSHAPLWENTSWEELVAGYRDSDSSWVAATARAWLAHIRETVPVVDGATRWNDIGAEDIYLALRLRSMYLHDHVDVPEGARRALTEIGSGGLFAAQVDAPIAGTAYSVRWEATEALPTQDVGRAKGAAALRGVDIRFFLVQQGVSTSAHFDWDHLAYLWHAYLADEDWIPWQRGVPRKRVDWEQEGVRRLLAQDAPPFLGVGYGEGQARLSREVLFGARFVLPATSTLDEATQVLSRVGRIGARMAADPRRPR